MNPVSAIDEGGEEKERVRRKHLLKRCLKDRLPKGAKGINTLDREAEKDQEKMRFSDVEKRGD